MRETLMERLGLKTPPKVALTPEEEALEIRRRKKERWAKEKKEKEKADRRLQRKIDHANSTGGVFTQNFKKNNGDISWWKMCLY